MVRKTYKGTKKKNKKNSTSVVWYGLIPSSSSHIFPSLFLSFFFISFFLSSFLSFSSVMFPHLKMSKGLLFKINRKDGGVLFSTTCKN